VRPGKVWDTFLWISSAGMLFAAGCLIFKSTSEYIAKLNATTPAAVESLEKPQ
jgi:hypothetical protein